MADIVNLRLARKRKGKAEKDAVAAANRALHGQTKAQKLVLVTERRLAASHLDAHRLDRPSAKDE